LLELIDALLTTTGCGRPLQQPQPIDLRVLAVNEFMTIFRPKFLSFWLAHHPPATLAVKIQTSPQIRVKKNQVLGDEISPVNAYLFCRALRPTIQFSIRKIRIKKNYTLMRCYIKQQHRKLGVE